MESPTEFLELIDGRDVMAQVDGHETTTYMEDDQLVVEVYARRKNTRAEFEGTVVLSVVDFMSAAEHAKAQAQDMEDGL